ncbi:MAG TPA: hypothetical protein PK771_02505, partial [Spirochaetota bacterium]|nr:hypothetical protein [Spirochaetota bacterium]
MKEILIFIIMLISFNLFSNTIKYDELNIDENNFLTLKIHNLTNDEGKNLKLFIEEKENNNFTSQKIKNNWLFGIIIDNSGSMLVPDFLTILSRMNYLLSNVEKDDYLI